MVQRIVYHCSADRPDAEDLPPSVDGPFSAAASGGKFPPCLDLGMPVSDSAGQRFLFPINGGERPPSGEHGQLLLDFDN